MHATYHSEFESTQLAMSLQILRIIPNVILRFNIFHLILHIREIFCISYRIDPEVTNVVENVGSMREFYSTVVRIER